MIVLKIIGWIILAIIALIVLVLCIKVRIFAEYSEIDTRLRIQWLFLKIPLFPSENKSDSKNKKSGKKDKADKTDESQEASQNDTQNADTELQSTADEATAEEASLTDDVSPSENNVASDAAETPQKKNNILKTLYDAHGVDGLLLIVKRLFSYLGTYIGDLAKSLVIDELYLDVRCTKKDAASTAIYYGEVCSALFPMLGALISKYKVKKYDINVYPDYLARQSSASFAVSMHLYPIYLIGITLLFGCRMLFKVLLRLIVKIFLPKKKENAENSNNAGNKAPATQN